MAVQEMLWKSKNGKHFKTEKEADRDDEIIEAKQFFEDNPIYGNFEGCKVYGSDIEEYLDTNRDIILQYYGIKIKRTGGKL